MVAICEAFGCLHRILGNFGSKTRDKIQNRVRKDRKGIKKGWGSFYPKVTRISFIFLSHLVGVGGKLSFPAQSLYTSF